MSLTLAIDTSTDVRVGLAADGAVLASSAVTDPRAHAEQLMPLIERTLADADRRLADVTQIVVGVGPGPFTGLRVGVVTAHTLGFVLGVPVRGVCSLDAGAAGHEAAGEFVVVSDARRREVYWRRYGADGTPLGEPQVTAPDAVPALPVAGAVPDHAPALTATGPARLDPGVLAARWETLAPAGDEPYYLRQADATVPGKPKSALPRLRAR